MECENGQQYGVYGRSFRAVCQTCDIADRATVTALGIGRECLIKMSEGGLAIGAGAALSGSPTASELQKDPTEKKEVWLCYCTALQPFKRS